MRQVIICFQLVILSVAAYMTAVILTSFINYQNQLTKINDQSDRASSAVTDMIVRNSLKNPDYLFWDADISYNNGLINYHHASMVENKGYKQVLLSRSYGHYQQALHFRPRATDSLLGSLIVLIDQGAPADHILPKLDRIISIIPTDDMFKAEATLVCFKLMALNFENKEMMKSITLRLQKLLSIPLDYRAMTEVKRYARLYSEPSNLEEVLIKVLKDG